MVHLSSGITNLKTLDRKGFKGFLFTQEEGNIRLWRMVSTTKYFGVTNSAIAQLENVENLQLTITHGGRRGGLHINFMWLLYLFVQIICLLLYYVKGKARHWSELLYEMEHNIGAAAIVETRSQV